MDIRHWFLKYSWAVNLALITTLAFILAKACNLYMADNYFAAAAEKSKRVMVPRGSGRSYRPPVEAILSRDLFQAKKEYETYTTSDTTEGDTTDIQVTELRLSLLGIAFWSENNPNNLATIKNLKDQEIDLYRAGDQVFEDEAVLYLVKVDRVVLERKNGDKEELLLELLKKKPKGGRGYKEALDEVPLEQRAKQFRRMKERAEARKAKQGVDLSDRIKQVGENDFVIQQSAIEEALSNLNSIVTQARVIPNFQGRGDERVVNGFRIYRIQPGSIFQYLGLQNGDVIKSINGESMDSVEKGIQLLQALRNETSFSMNIERQRNPVELSYEVE